MPYNAGDVKWGTPTLGTPSGTITWSADYVTALNYSPTYSAAEFDAALTAAFDAWESVASIDFQQVAPGSGADVTVISGSLGGSVAGTANYTFGGNPGLSEIFSGTVTFNSDLTWSPFGGGGGVDFHAVALHEIGHILGLGHVNDTSEIMNPVVYANSLGSGDIAGVQFLYGRDPSDAPAPSGEGPEAPTSVGVSATDDGGGGGGGAGILLGLLAAVLGLLLGGGLAAGAAFAAARVPDNDDDPQDVEDQDGHDHDHDPVGEGVMEHTHVVYVPETAPVPLVAFDDQASPCGCYGPCECLLEEAGAEFTL